VRHSRRTAALVAASAVLAACGGARPDFPGPVAPLTPTPDASFRWRLPAPAATAVPALNAHWHKLENGFTVVHLERDDLPIVALRYVNRLGGTVDSAFSGEQIALTADALIHAGTRFDGGNVLSQVRINGILPAVMTTQDSTVVGIDVLAPALSRGVELLARSVQSPVFDAGGIDVARGLTLEMLRNRFDDFETLAMDQALSDLLGHQLARDLSAANQRVVKTLTRDELMRCFAELYRPDVSALIVVGAAGRDEVLELARRWFGSWQPARSNAWPKPKAVQPRAPAAGVRIHLVPSYDRSQASLLLAKPGAALFSEHYAALRVAGVALGDAASSRLNRALRQEQAKTYGVQAGHETDRQLAMFTIRGSFDASEIGGVVADLIAELSRLAREPLAPAELSSARARVRAQLTDRLATNSGTADTLAWLFESEAADGLERFDRALATVDARLVREAARRYLDPASLDVFVMGPPDNVASELGDLGTLRMYRVVERD
jgi:zinc protease